MDYLKFILIGAPYMAASLVLNNQLRFEGSAFYGMIGLYDRRPYQYSPGSDFDIRV